MLYNNVALLICIYIVLIKNMSALFFLKSSNSVQILSFSNSQNSKVL